MLQRTLAWVGGVLVASGLLFGCSSSKSNGGSGGQTGADAGAGTGGGAGSGTGGTSGNAGAGGSAEAGGAGNPDAGADATAPDAASACATDCSELDGPCQVGVCNQDAGACEAQAAADTTPCDDGNPCRTGATCTAGKCGGGTLTCAIPTGLTTDTPTASTMIGAAGTTSDETCPAGQVLVGVYGSHYPSASQPTLFEWFESAGGICAPIGWVWDAASTSYHATAGTTTDLAEVGQHDPAADWRRQCPDGSVIVGVDAAVYSGTLTQMTFKCAPLRAAYVSSAWHLDVGAPAALPACGLGMGSGASSNCPTGEIGAGLHLGANSSGSATGISFLCATPSLVVGK